MRIISDFHDYYDCIQAQGQDQTLIYLRRPVEESYKEKNMPFDLPSFQDGNVNMHNRVSVRTYAVGFCGKIHPILKLYIQKRDGNEFAATCFTMAEVEDFMVKVLKKKDFDSYEKKKFRYWRLAGVLNGRNRKKFEEFFQKWEAKRESFQNLFDEHKAPLFVVDFGRDRQDSNRKITWNGCLKDLEFFRIVEPFTAFQELSLGWGNVAQPNRPIPEVSDEDMLIAKGFDPKWSFRKEPAK